MTEDVLKLYLPAFIIVFIWVALLWRSFTRFSGICKNLKSRHINSYSRLKRIYIVYRCIIIVFFVMIVVFSFLPGLYKWLFPIQPLNNPVINLTGFLILKVALVWVVVAQMMLDKELYKYSRDIESLSAMEMVHVNEKILLKGFIVMFIGMFVTLSNLLAVVLVLIALIIYFKPQLLSRRSNNNFSRFQN